MKIFLDTEFTDFIDTELISIGLVSNDGREFYAEISNYSKEKCSEFVNAVVVPLLGKYPRIVGTCFEVAVKLEQWLKEYKDSGCILCYDYQTDWDLFYDLLQYLPEESNFSFVSNLNIWTDLDPQRIKQYWKDTGLPEHMALFDARANRIGYDIYNAY